MSVPESSATKPSSDSVSTEKPVRALILASASPVLAKTLLEAASGATTAEPRPTSLRPMLRTLSPKALSLADACLRPRTSFESSANSSTNA